MFIHSSVDWHLGCFHLLVIVSHAPVNTGVQTHIRWSPSFQFLGGHETCQSFLSFQEERVCELHRGAHGEGAGLEAVSGARGWAPDVQCAQGRPYPQETLGSQKLRRRPCTLVGKQKQVRWTEHPSQSQGLYWPLRPEEKTPKYKRKRKKQTTHTYNSESAASSPSSDGFFF